MNNERGFKSNWNRNIGRNMRGGNRGGRGGSRGHWAGKNKGFRGNRPDNFGGYRGGNNSQDRFSWKKNQKRETPGKRLSEDEIGVTEYITDHEGFNGVIKSRYSDFQVSEVNEKGEVAKLTDMNPPQPPAEDIVDEDEDLLLSKYNLEILPMETWDQINSVSISKDPENAKVEIDVAGMTKEQRTRIHDAVKKAFGGTIVGSTVNINDQKFMRFEKFRKGVRIDNRVKWIWPGEYVYFIVHKENCDTMEAAVRIAERLRLNVKPSMLGYAGTKDRRAKTSQWFSLRRVDPRRVAAACGAQGGLPALQLGNYSFSDTNLKLGMLKGNRFRIALRNVTADSAAVRHACECLRDKGFLNYYGLQRFGARHDNPTYRIGRLLLQDQFKKAIDSILSPREGPLQAALEAYGAGGGGGAGGVGGVAGGAVAACGALPRHGAHIEARLIRALAAAPNDYAGALNKLPRNTRLLYLHSYQSLVWNLAVSERVRRLGLAPAAGDLVLDAEPFSDLDVPDVADVLLVDDSDNEGETELDGAEKQNEPENPTNASKTNKSKKDQNFEDKQKIPVTVLTQEDIDNSEYTIFDIVLPLPGYNIEYPPNMRDFYETTLKKDGLTMELRHRIKSYSMSGAYRRMTARPRDVEWQLVRYDEPHADLIASDLDQLRGTPLTGIVDDGKYKALLLNMTLPASCYATMALRELLKVDTSSDNQALQNNYHKRKLDKAEENGKKEEEDGVVEKMNEEEDGKTKLDEEEVVAKKIKKNDE